MSRRNRPKLGCSEAHDFARAASHSTTAWRALCLALLGLAGMFGQPGSASAQGYWAWAPLGVGCARAISVGPNGVPWILGCTGGNPNGTGPAWVYYLTWSNAPEIILHYVQVAIRQHQRCDPIRQFERRPVRDELSRQRMV